MRLPRFVWGIPLFIGLTLLTGEGLLRLRSSFMSPEEKQQKRLLDEFVTRVQDAYSRKRKNDPFHLPYNIYSNDDFRNPAKLKEVYAGTRYPPGSWITDDFLDPDPAPEFRVTINRLGFRGKDHPEGKAPDTKRIIVLGSYHAFGAGIGDGETYPERLEEKLNRANAKTTYEVWNAGRLSASSIVGLATLKEEKFWDLKPDLIILDYGFVDPLSLNDSTYGVSLAQTLSFHSLLWKALDLNDRLFGVKKIFADIMEEMLTILRAKKVSFIVVKQLNSLSLDEFPDRFPPGSYPFLNAYFTFANHRPSPAQWESVPWLKDVPREYWQKIPAAPFAPYMKNIFHYSPAGHDVLAAGLAEKIVKVQ